MPLTYPTRNAVASSAIHRLEIQEPIDVFAALFRSAEDLRSSLRDLPVGPRLTVVLHAPPTLSADELYQALGSLPVADWLVVTWNGGDVPQGVARGLRAWWQSARGKSGPGILLEPHPARAVIGAMQWLRAGDTFLVLWPAALGKAAVEALVAQGGRWREAWEAPEDGDFQPLPASGPGGT